MEATEFFKSDNFNNGVKVPLENLDGETTEHWIELISRASRESEVLRAKLQAELVELAEAEKGGDEKAHGRAYDTYTKFLAAHVKAWSFDGECTPKIVFETLSQAKKFRDQIDKKIHETDFFAKGSTP